MDQFLAQLISTLFQLILLGVIPFIWWVVFARKQGLSFPKYLGLTKIKAADPKKLLSFSGLCLLVFTLIGYFSLQVVADHSVLANSQFVADSVWTIPAVVLYSFVQTGFSEELFFRGFLAKRAIKQFGYVRGNLMQASLFGLLHVLMLVPQSKNLFLLIFVGVLTGVIGYVMGYLNEKLAQGSILPSWLIHGCTNLVSTVLLMYFI